MFGIRLSFISFTSFLLMILTLLLIYNNAEARGSSEETETIQVNAIHPGDSLYFGKEHLKKTHAQNLQDFLHHEVTGLDMPQSGGAGQVSSLFLRGAETRHTLIVLDGVILNDPSSPAESYNLANIPLSSIDSIEILYGAQSVRFGSGAVGGVINIKSKKQQREASNYLHASGGSYNTFSSAITRTAPTYSLDLNHAQSKGISAADKHRHPATTPDGYKRNQIFASHRHFFNDNNALSLSMRYLRNHTDIDSYIWGQGLVDDPNAYINEKQLITEVKGEHSAFNDHLQTDLAASINNYERENKDASFQGTFKGRIEQTELSNELLLSDYQPSKLHLNLGQKKEVVRAESNYDYFPRHHARTFFAFAENHIPLSDTFYLSPGLRFEQHQIYKEMWSYQMVTAYRGNSVSSNGQREIKLSYSKGHKAPNLFQLYSPAYGNLSLRPEIVHSAELMLKEEINQQHHWQMKCTLFHNDYRDLFSYDQQGKTINLNRAVNKGYELSSTIDLVPSFLNLSGDYTRLYAFNKENGSYLSRRPQHRAHIALLTFLSEQHQLRFHTFYQGHRNDLDENNKTVIMPSHVLLHADWNYVVNSEWQTQLSLKNLLNKQYEEVYGYGTEGRSYYVSFRYAF